MATSWRCCLRGCHALLASGLVDVDCRDAEGATPLHRAAAAGNQHTVELLLGHGAGVNVLDNASCSPLHYAKCQSKTASFSIPATARQ